MTSTSSPGGASPYSPLSISVSVPSIPTSRTPTATVPDSAFGWGSFSKRALSGVLGLTPTASIVWVITRAMCPSLLDARHLESDLHSDQFHFPPALSQMRIGAHLAVDRVQSEGRA